MEEARLVPILLTELKVSYGILWVFCECFVGVLWVFGRCLMGVCAEVYDPANANVATFFPNSACCLKTSRPPLNTKLT